MEQDRSKEALETIRRAKSNMDCSSASSRSAALLCVRILAQEADISREVGEYLEAVQVSLVLFTV